MALIPNPTELAWLIGGVVAGSLVTALFIWLCSLPQATADVGGVVKSCVYHPAYTTIVPQQVGKVTTFRTVHHPERWECQIDVEEAGISATLHEFTKEGDRVILSYRFERIRHADR